MTLAHPLTAFVIIFTMIPLDCVIILHYGGKFFPPDWGLCVSSPQNVTDEYSTRVTPADYTMQIWILIFAAQVLWVLYAYTLLCRKSASGYLYHSPDFMPMYLVYWLSLACSIIYDFLCSYMIPGLVFIGLVFIFLFACSVSSVYFLNKNIQALVQQSKKSDIWWVRLLVQQSLALYTTWVLFSFHIYLAFVLVYEGGMSDENASRLVIGMLTAFFIPYFILDISVLDKYLRYMIGPYLVFIWTLVGIIVKNWDMTEVSSIMIIVLLAVVGIATLTKVTVTIYRVCKYPDPQIGEVEK